MGRKERTLIIAIGANAVLIILRFILADISGSVALKASAWHSFADIFVSLFVLAGFIISRIVEKPQLKNVSRIENIVAIIISLFVFGVGFEILGEIVKKPSQELNNIPWVMLWSLLTVAICYFMSRYKLYVGKQTNSPALIADGYHSKMDVYASLIVIAGLAGYLIGFNSLDRLVAVIIVLFIFYGGWEILSNALKTLSASYLEIENIKNESLSENMIDVLRNISKEKKLNTNIAAMIIQAIKWAEKILASMKFLVKYFDKRRKLVLLSVLGVLAIIYISSGIYVIGPDESAIVRRFGKKMPGVLSSGLYYRFPKPIDIVDKVKTHSILKTELSSFYLMTGDENLVKVNLSIHYQINKPENYLFKNKNVEIILQQNTKAALSQVVADRIIDDIITVGRKEMQDIVKVLLQEMMDKNESGINIVDVQLLNVMPPDEVIDAFRDVFSAREDKEAFINEAYSFANEIIPQARGDAEKNWKLAEGYQLEKVNSATGEAARFQNKLKGYWQSKEATKTRLRLETTDKVLPKVKKYIVNSSIIRGSKDLWFVDDKTAKTKVIE